jgi:hypothetical protein
MNPSLCSLVSPCRDFLQANNIPFFLLSHCFLLIEAHLAVVRFATKPSQVLNLCRIFCGTPQPIPSLRSSQLTDTRLLSDRVLWYRTSSTPFLAHRQCCGPATRPGKKYQSDQLSVFQCPLYLFALTKIDYFKGARDIVLIVNVSLIGWGVVL